MCVFRVMNPRGFVCHDGELFVREIRQQQALKSVVLFAVPLLPPNIFISAMKRFLAYSTVTDKEAQATEHIHFIYRNCLQIFCHLSGLSWRKNDFMHFPWKTLSQ